MIPYFGLWIIIVISAILVGILLTWLLIKTGEAFSIDMSDPYEHEYFGFGNALTEGITTVGTAHRLSEIKEKIQRRGNGARCQSCGRDLNQWEEESATNLCFHCFGIENT
jgi:hypothetical protein